MIAEQKAALRDRMRQARTAIDPAERARLPALVEDHLFGLKEFRDAATVLLFYSFGSEVASGGIAAHATAAGKRVLLPYLEGGIMEAAEVDPPHELVPTDYGPKEPSKRTPVDPAGVDLVVAPGLAFDRRGRRLGYGRGYYDRFLDRLRPDTLRVGIAFSIQLVDEVPAGRRDRRVHLVVTDAGIIDCRTG